MAEGAGIVARAAAAAGATGFVQVSAIGADLASRSGYGRAKAEGEAAVLAAFPAATVLRPSIVFGAEDQFFNRFAGMAQALPFMPVIAGATRFQPVYVGDVADAVIAVLGRPEAAGRVYELGGPQVFTFRELLAWILRETERKRPLITVPRWLACLQAGVMERLPGKLLTRDQLLMLKRDNVVSAGAVGLAELGIVPTPIDLVVPAYLRRFRPGGGTLRPDTDEPARVRSADGLPSCPACLPPVASCMVPLSWYGPSATEVTPPHRYTSQCNRPPSLRSPRSDRHAPDSPRRRLPAAAARRAAQPPAPPAPPAGAAAAQPAPAKPSEAARKAALELNEKLGFHQPGHGCSGQCAQPAHRRPGA